jgi:hypothetical protein
MESGIYLYRLQALGYVETRKMVVICGEEKDSRTCGFKNS